MAKKEKHFLEIADLRKSFGQGEARQDVLRGVNFTVEKGEVCVLLGPSGSGKSTLLNIIGAIDKPGGVHGAVGGVSAHGLRLRVGDRLPAHPADPHGYGAENMDM